LKDLTCAVLLRFKNKFLICHVTGQYHQTAWSLPKGLNENNETLIFTAGRELFEETGVKINYRDLKYIGLFNYYRNKDMALFEYKLPYIISTTNLYCSSMFYDKKTNMDKPEVDKYMYVTFKHSEQYLNNSTFNILKNLYNERKILNE